MSLESPDSLLSLIVVIHICGHELKLDLPGDSDGMLVGRTSLVVEDLEINCKAMGYRAGHDGIVGGNAMGVALGLEGLLEDEVTIGVIGNHDILVARLGLDKELACIIRVELADGEYTNKDLIGQLFGGTGWLVHDNGCRRRWLGRMDVLALLGEMTQDGLV